MDDIRDFDPNKLKISSDEINEYNMGKPHSSYDPSTIKERRELSLKYKGGKPKFRVDGRLYHLLYPCLFLDDEGDVISYHDFMISLEGRMYSLFKEIMDQEKILVWFVCEVDGVWAYDLRIPFRGTCEIEIDRVTCWLLEKYSNSFKVELIAKNVKVGKLLNVKSKYEEMFYTQ